MPRNNSKTLKVTALSVAGLLVAGSIAGIAANATNEKDDLTAPAVEQLDQEPDTGEQVEVDEENHVVKESGEEAALTDETGQQEIFTIAVNQVTTANTCPSRLSGELSTENGTFYFVEIEAELRPLAELPAGATEEDAFMPLLADTFKLKMADQSIVDNLTSESSWGCFTDEHLLPSFVTAGETVAGIVVLDGPANAEKIIYDPTNSGGWTWPVVQTAPEPEVSEDIEPVEEPTPEESAAIEPEPEETQTSVEEEVLEEEPVPSEEPTE